MTLATDVQKLEPGAIVELFELDLTPFGGDLLRFHAGTNGLLANVTWNGNAYTAFPVAASGFEFTGQGQAPRPKLMVSNIAGAITALVLQYEDLVGAKVTRRRTLAKYLDAVNFAARRNLLTYTESVDNAAWGKFGGATAVPSATVLAPNGTLTADTLTISLTKQISNVIASAPAGTYCFSAYYKSNGTIGAYHQMNCAGSGATIAAVSINFSSVTLSTRFGTPVSAGIQSVGDGWFRVWIVGTHVTGGIGVYFVSSTTPDDSVLVWGAQLELASTPSAYQPVLTTWSQNPTADPSAEFPQDIFYIDRKSVETSEIVEFELAPAMDITGVMLPRRQIIQNICPWSYRGSECGYTGTTYFDVTDVPVGSAGLDVCGKRLTSCKLRFGQYAELPFGGFPVAGLFR